MAIYMDEYRTTKICPQCGSLRIIEFSGKAVPCHIFKVQDVKYSKGIIVHINQLPMDSHPLQPIILPTSQV